MVERAAAAVAVGLFPAPRQGRHVVGRRRPVAQQPLQPVDGRRIVRGRDDRTAVGVQPPLGIVDHGRGQQPEVDHVETGLRQPIPQRRQKWGRGGADVPADDELGHRRQSPAQRPPPACIECGRQFLGRIAADVARFVDAHGRPRFRGSSNPPLSYYMVSGQIPAPHCGEIRACQAAIVVYPGSCQSPEPSVSAPARARNRRICRAADSSLRSG